MTLAIKCIFGAFLSLAAFPDTGKAFTLAEAEQLLARGVPVEFYVDPAGGHNVFPQERVFEFFEKNLR